MKPAASSPCDRATIAPVLVIGLGNPILGDDGVGWRIAQEVGRYFTDGAQVEVDCLSVGGLALMERMLGYDRVILLDALETGSRPAGSVTTLDLKSLQDPIAGHSASAHDTSLNTALNAAEAMGAVVPRRVDLVAVEIHNSRDFSEELSPAVAEAIPIALHKILELLDR